MNLPHLLEAIILGAVQGITEYLPVSSTGHMAMLQQWFGLDPATYGLSFDLFTNIGTVAAIIWFFRKDLVEIFRKLRLPGKQKFTKEELLPWWIIWVTVLVGIAGVIAEPLVESATVRSGNVIAAGLITFGIVMLVAEKVSIARKDHRELTAPSAFATGLAQILAFIPGVSRSGATISTGMFFGLSRAAAARYSFLLSIPVTAAAILKRMMSFAKHADTLTGDVVLFYVVGALVAGICAYYTIRFLLAYLSTRSLAVFAYYRFAFALVILLTL